MKSASQPPPADTPPEWIADLTLEYEGRLAATLVSDGQRCVLKLADLAAFKTLGPALAVWKTARNEALLSRIADALPRRLEIHLHGVPVGDFHPRGAPNWEARLAGLPFGRLAVDKMALLRAALKRG